MPFLGNIINFAVVLVASLLGALIRRGIPERIKTAVFYAISICVIYIGLDGALGEAPATDGFLSSDLAKFVIMEVGLNTLGPPQVKKAEIFQKVTFFFVIFVEHGYTSSTRFPYV